jgi:hypothetical protein
VRVKVRVRVSLDLVVGRDECVQEHRRAARVHAVCSRRGSHVLVAEQSLPEGC